MMKYKKIIILSSVLLVLIALITLTLIFDVDMILFKNLSIASIQDKRDSVLDLISNKDKEEQNYNNERKNLENSKNNFDVEKEKYENTDESTISMVQEANKEEKYFIEYLWVVLGNYASSEGVKIDIITPGSSENASVENEQNTDGQSQTTTNQSTTPSAADVTLPTDKVTGRTTNQNQNMDMVDQDIESSLRQSRSNSSNDRVKITVEGRYANVADFVFDVENDTTLKFKLDNISMTYKGDNTISASFDVISLSVLQ